MKKRVVLVTGASRGIGKAIALKFATKGYHLIITCHEREKELQKLKEQIEQNNVSCHAFTGDLGDYQIVKNLFTQIKENIGSVDVLINNAGISYVGLFTDMNVNDWNRVIQTNLGSVFHCCKLAVPDMIRQKEGKIINISSVWGNCGASCEVAYSASKGGINSFTKALAKELAPSNIQVNAIACGVINTEMNSFLDENEKIALVEDIPACRFGETNEVADFIYTLATGHNYLTGQVINFDGGWM
jgi:3-oxoacyl-[acyl-carrier protein] reductase